MTVSYADIPKTVAGSEPRPVGAISVAATGVTMRFGSFTALDDVSIDVRAGSFHALLGENGAGKSTLVKCIMGFYRPTAGTILVGGNEVEINTPRDASALGLGMVYQHFTLVPSLSGAENLVISRRQVPGIIDWKREREGLATFMETMPFKVPLEVPVRELAAGQKQKLEIIKQLYLGRNFLVLDEPTSVLTPGEATEVLGLVRGMTERGEITVLMISHKFHEVTAFADDITVLRRGRLAGTGKVKALTTRGMAAMMIGDAPLAKLDSRAPLRPDAEPILSVRALRAPDRSGLKSIDIADLVVKSGEIVGIAGISGNGQKELAEVLAGQRLRDAGSIAVKGDDYGATRGEARRHNVRFIPEEPLSNACAPRMSVAENLAFRTFDLNAEGRTVAFVDAGRMRKLAGDLVGAFKVKTSSLASPIAALSGGNIQRAVLARELSGDVDLLIVANPCFGLDFSAVAEIRARIMKARNAGGAVLLISEDLDELMELSDRIVVMSEGSLVYETPIGKADINVIGEHMAGHH